VTTRRELADMLMDVTDGVLVATAGAPGLRARRFEMVLPIDIALGRRAGAPVLFGDVARTRLHCDFDPVPSRFRIVWEEEAGA